MGDGYEYTYTDTEGDTLKIGSTGIPGGICVHTIGAHSLQVLVHLPPSERRKAAQALAGDDWHVVPKWTERENDRLERENVELRERLHGTDQPDLHVGEPIDPKDAKVGDVVSVEADDGTWGVWGEVDMVDPGDDEPFRLKLWGSQRWPTLLNATVRVVSRPEPAGDQVVAINTILRGIERDAGGDLSDLTAPRIARELHARGVRVVEAGGQR